MLVDANPRRVLVAYATARGSTRGIAERIGTRLVDAGFDVDVLSVDRDIPVGGYDACVIGSAVRTQAWLPEACQFVRDKAAALSVRPVWLFSVSSVGEASSFFGPRFSRFLAAKRHDLESVAEARKLVSPRGHHDFAGAIAKGDWSWAGGLMLRLLGGSYGDHRNWAEVDAWADEIATTLAAGVAAPAPVGEAAPVLPAGVPVPLPGHR
jgi:menaquinone-dependent protoporphyrinogen oxidase